LNNPSVSVSEIDEIVDDIANMINRFVRARMYSLADKLANATSKEIIEATLYEALRISRSTLESGGTLDENVRPYVAKENNIKKLLAILDEDLEKGIDIVRKIAIRALAFPSKKEKGEKEEV